MRTVIRIGRWEFKNKSEVMRMARAILLRYPLYGRLRDVDAEFFLALYLSNPYASHKGDRGIIGFRRRGDLPEGQLGIEILDIDGRPRDWSWERHLDPPKTQRSRVLAAMRQEYGPDRRRYLAWAAIHLPDPFVCPIYGELTHQAHADADHAPPGTFDAIVHGWMTERGLDWDDIRVEGGQDRGVVLPHFTDPAQRASYLAYHAAHVDWRLVSRRGNSGILRRDPTGRAAAEAASRECPSCGGAGTLLVFDPGYDGRRSVAGVTMIVPAHCTCAAGRWIRPRVPAEFVDRIVDLADVYAGRSRYRQHPPEGVSAPAYRPIP